MSETEKFFLDLLFACALWMGSWLCPPIPKLARPRRPRPDPRVHVRKVGSPWR